MITKRILDTINGKEVMVHNFQLVYDAYAQYPIIYMDVVFNDVELSLKFSNASRLNITNWSFPFQISELLIKYNAGWDNPSKCFICDFEEESISFYCEDIEMLESNNKSIKS